MHMACVACGKSVLHLRMGMERGMHSLYIYMACRYTQPVGIHSLYVYIA